MKVEVFDGVGVGLVEGVFGEEGLVLDVRFEGGDGGGGLGCGVGCLLEEGLLEYCVCI